MPFTALTETTVNQTLLMNQQYSSITTLNDGSIVVTWTDYNLAADGTGSAIRARVLSASGTPLTSEFTVNQIATGDQYVSAVIALQDGGFAVTWEDSVSSTTSVSAMAFGWDGTSASVTMAQQTLPGVDPAGSSPDITQLSNGDLVVSYTAERTTASEGNDAVITHIGSYSSSTPVINSYPLTNEPGLNQTDVAVTAHNAPGAGFTAAWFQDGDLVITSFVSPGIPMAGSQIVVEGGPAANVTGNDMRPSIHTLDDGKVLVMWTGNGNWADTDGTGVYAVLYETNGLFSAYSLNQSDAGDQSFVSFAQVSPTQIVATWYDNSPAGDGDLSSIKGQILNYNGSVLTYAGDEFVVNSSTTGDQWVPVVTATDTGGFAISWTDFQGPRMLPGNVLSDEADVKIRYYELNGANAAPVITSLGGGATATVNMLSGQTFVVDASASDANPGDTQTWSKSGGAHEAYFTINSGTGVLSFNGPAPSGTYEVDITVTDAAGATDTQTITVNVTNTPPAAADDSYVVAVDTPLLINNLFANDTDAEDGQLDYTDFVDIDTLPSNGTLTDNGNGTFTYTPNAGFVGTDSFIYRVQDSEGVIDTATATLTVTANTAPRFNPGFASSTVTNPAGYAEGHKMVQDPVTGAYYVAGLASPGVGSGYNMVVTKFNADGTVDDTFGVNGVVTVSGLSDSEAYDMALDAGGNIVLSGLTGSTAPASFAVVRLQSNGAFDTSFGGGDGIVTALPASGPGFGDSVLIQPDGKIVVTGSGGAADSNFIVMRFNADGTPDTSFGTGGVAETEGTGLSQADVSSHAALTPDGKIVVVGRTYDGVEHDTVIVRYNADGSLDTSFNPAGTTPGIYVTDLDSNGESARGVTVLSDGTIIVVGAVGASDPFSGSTDISILRYNPDNSVDSFTQDFGIAAEGRAVAVQPDGKIVVAGYTFGGIGNVQFAVVRFDSATGALDTSFGDGTGYVVSDFATGQGGIAYSLLIEQPTGDILISGSRFADQSFVIFRLGSDGTVDTSFGAGSSLDGQPTHTVGGSAVVIDSSVAVFDDELDALGDYGGTSVTLERAGGANADDSFEGSGLLGPLVDGDPLVLDGTEIGQVSLIGGQLILTFDFATTQADVNAVLSSIAYKYVGTGTPPSQVDIAWTFSDGDASAPLSVTDTTTILLQPNTGPVTHTFDWSDRETKLSSSDPDSLASIFFDATNPAPDGFIEETQVDFFTTSDTVAHLIEAAGGPTGYSQTDNFVITGTSQGYDATYGHELGGDTINTADGNDIVTPNGGRDNVNTGGGDDVVIVTTLVASPGTEQQFFGNVFDGGTGTDRIEVSGGVNLGGNTGVLDGILTRTLLGFEELRFTRASGESYNYAYLRIPDITDVDGIHLITGSDDFDQLSIGPEPGETYATGRIIDISGITFANWNSNGFNDEIVVHGTDKNDTITGNSAGYNQLIGGDGDDIIYGASNGNWLDGGAGVDELHAGAGSDTLSGGLGADKLYGSADGQDWVYYGSSAAGVTINLTTNVNTGGDAQGDQIYNINFVQASFAADKITGNAAANTIYGLKGADTIYGKNGNDVVYAGDENDRVYGENHNDTLYGELGNDTLYGGSGDDNLYGGDGDDVFYGGAGADDMFGDSGTLDIAYYTTSASGVIVNLQSNINTGGDAEGDKLYSIERVHGSNQSDSITGNGAVNYLLGNAGNDTLRGGMGADLLYGGAGSDTFVFGLGDTGQSVSSIDQVKDYVKGAINVGDKIDFVSDLAVGGSNALATASQASIDAATGVATFASGSGKSLVDAISDIANRFSALTDTEGEFALFRINGAGDFYAFISDGLEGVTSTDTVFRLTGVTSVTSTDLTAGDLTLLA